MQMRLAFVAALACALPSRVSAESFDALQRRIEFDDEVRVLARSGERVEGRLIRIAPDELVLANEQGLAELPAADVVSVQRRGDSIWNGAAIGAATGLAFGAACAASEDDDDDDCDGGDVVGSAVVTGLLGAGLDWAIRGWRSVYDAPPSPVSVGAGADGGSFALSVRF